MLDQRRRRWANIKPTPAECLVFAGYRPNSIVLPWMHHRQSPSAMIPTIHEEFRVSCTRSSRRLYADTYYNSSVIPLIQIARVPLWIQLALDPV